VCGRSPPATYAERSAKAPKKNDLTTSQALAQRLRVLEDGAKMWSKRLPKVMAKDGYNDIENVKNYTEDNMR